MVGVGEVWESFHSIPVFSRLYSLNLCGPHGVNSSAPTFKDFKKWFPELNLVDPRESYRVKMVIDRKKRNKGGVESNPPPEASY
ncbi:hypothetical protein JCM33374_g6604 [Metschnikowia sp. JCM 33374]|nr:hypothetical protein JCM33374_g6604 [Metschnikowia sp. JCM 33374]